MIVDMGRDDTWGEYSVERFETALRARVVGYERWALATAVARVNAMNDVHLATIVLDACLVHARCCTEFLVGRVRVLPATLDEHDGDMQHEDVVMDAHCQGCSSD